MYTTYTVVHWCCEIVLAAELSVILLDIVLCIVEKNPKKFKMEDSELRERKAFVKMTKNSVKVLYKHHEAS